MSEIKKLTTPLTADAIRDLKAGDSVLLSGVIYTARDKAHKRLCDTLAEGKPLPVALENQLIYYVGPAPAKPGQPIGSCGPTTSSRMDKYAPKLLDMGLGAMIGKGKRNQSVLDAIVRNQSVYFAAIGGAGALLSKCITSSEVIAYDDLGAEAIRKMEVKDFPVVVVVDSEGNNLYETAVMKYRK